MRAADYWPIAAIRHAIAPDLPELEMEVVAQIDSTNSELMRRARAGYVGPVLLVAEQQTAGRGRLGRQWFSGEADVEAASLTFSLGLPLTPRNWSGLSLAVGVSVVEALHSDLRLKWPNDIWYQGRKLAGILIETASLGGTRYVVVGIGANIGQPLTTGLSTAPAWLQELLPEANAAQALLRIVGPLAQAIRLFEAHGFTPFQQRFDRRDALAGVPVSLGDGMLGTARGVDALGALQVQTGQGLRSINSAEVSVRPLSG